MKLFTRNYKTYSELNWALGQLQKEILADLEFIKTVLENSNEENSKENKND